MVVYQSCPWVGSTRGSGRVGSNLYACLFFVMSRYFEGIYGMAVDNCVIILDGYHKRVFAHDFEM